MPNNTTPKMDFDAFDRSIFNFQCDLLNFLHADDFTETDYSSEANASIAADAFTEAEYLQLRILLETLDALALQLDHLKLSTRITSRPNFPFTIDR